MISKVSLKKILKSCLDILFVNEEKNNKCDKNMSNIQIKK